MKATIRDHKVARALARAMRDNPELVKEVKQLAKVNGRKS